MPLSKPWSISSVIQIPLLPILHIQMYLISSYSVLNKSFPLYILIKSTARSIQYNPHDPFSFVIQQLHCPMKFAFIRIWFIQQVFFLKSDLISFCSIPLEESICYFNNFNIVKIIYHSIGISITIISHTAFCSCTSWSVIIY